MQKPVSRAAQTLNCRLTNPVERDCYVKEAHLFSQGQARCLNPNALICRLKRRPSCLHVIIYAW